MVKKFNITDVAGTIPFDPGGSTLTSENVNDAIIESLLVAGSSRFALLFGYNGNASNRYLELFASNPSNQTPFVVAETAEIASLSFAAKVSTTATATIYVNGSVVDTISLTAQQTNYESGLSWPLSPGDYISVQVTSGSVSDPMVAVNIKVA